MTLNMIISSLLRGFFHISTRTSQSLMSDSVYNVKPLTILYAFFRLNNLCSSYILFRTHALSNKSFLYAFIGGNSFVFQIKAYFTNNGH